MIFPHIVKTIETLHMVHEMHSMAIVAQSVSDVSAEEIERTIRTLTTLWPEEASEAVQNFKVVHDKIHADVATVMEKRHAEQATKS